LDWDEVKEQPGLDEELAWAPDAELELDSDEAMVSG